MEPLVIITSYNRRDELIETLQALEETTDLRKDVELVIVDNGSANGTVDLLCEWREAHSQLAHAHVILFPFNIGCPRALNRAMTLYRRPGQPVVKLDNDVQMLTVGWVDKVAGLIAGLEEQGRHVAMIGGNYEGALESRLLFTEQVEGQPRELHHVGHVIGHCVWHTGPFMDVVGFFDVLSPNHLYGFEDLLLSVKAGVLNWEMLVWEGWNIRNIQRKNALGNDRDEHVRQMRPLYDARRQAISSGGTLQTGADGCPVLH